MAYKFYKFIQLAIASEREAFDQMKLAWIYFANKFRNRMKQTFESALHDLYSFFSPSSRRFI